MALGSLLGWTGNPVYDALAQNRMALAGLGAGIASGTNLQQGLANGLQYAVTGSAADRAYQEAIQNKKAADAQENMTAAWLRANYPQYAGLPTDQGFQLALKDQSAKMAGGGQESWFGNPIPLQDAQGNFAGYGAISNQGNTKSLDFGSGLKPAAPVTYLNQGDQFTPAPKYGGDVTGAPIPINNQQASYDKAFGEGAGKAAIDRINALPQAVATSDNMMATIDGILNDPALDSSTGWLSWMQAVPNTDQYRFGQRALQLQGQAFLQAFQTLKGGGQITEVEGAKATQAIGRLSTAQSPQDYRDALQELKNLISAAKARAMAQAGMPAPQSGVPGGADLQSLKSKYGLQ